MSTPTDTLDTTTRNTTATRIQNNGDGFNPEHHSGLGFGLMGMRERVQNLGGKLSVNTQARQGTEVVAIVPLETCS